MKVKRVFIVVLLVVLGTLVLGQINVRISPQALPPKAPFTVFVSSDIQNVSLVMVKFNGQIATKTSVPAVFYLRAPTIPAQLTEFSTSLTVSIVNAKGMKESAKENVEISYNAKPVIVLKPQMKVKKGSFRGNASFEVEVYGGIGVKEVRYFVDGKVKKTWKNPYPALPLNFPKEAKKFEVNTSKIPNGRHIFSVAVVDVTGQVISTQSLSYTLNNALPEIKISKLNKCLPGSTSVKFKVTAVSTLSGIDYVKIDGKIADRLAKNMYVATLETPEKTGMWEITVLAVDNAGNEATKTVSVFVDDSKPELIVNTNAAYVQKDKNLEILWKSSTPLTISVDASVASQRYGCGEKVDFTVNGKKEITPRFETSISTPGTHVYTISATVVDPINGFKSSTTLKFAFKMDDKVPTIENIKFFPNALTNAEGYKAVPPASKVEITITATDGTGVGLKDIKISSIKSKYTKDRNGRTFVIPQLKDGINKYPVSVTLTDKVGNSTTITKKFKIFVDASWPVISIKPEANLFYKDIYWNKDKPMEFDVHSSVKSGVDPQLRVFLDGNEVYDETSGSYILDVNSSGSHAIKVKSTNRVNGNSTSVTKNVKVAFDDVPPLIENITCPATVGPNQKVEIKVKAIDSGIGIKEITINGVDATKIGDDEYVAPLTSPNWKKSGHWKINVEAKDLLGNTSKSSCDIFVDATAPSVDVEIFPNNHKKDGKYWSKDVPFFIQITANTDSHVAPLLKTWCNGNFLSQNATLITKDGTYKVTVKSTNIINHKVITKTVVYTVAFDKLCPVISDVTFAATSAPNQKIRVTAKVEDRGIGITKYVAINDKIMDKIGPDLYSATLTTPNYKDSGMFNLKIIAVDVFGNKCVYSTNTFVDANPPTIKLYLKDDGKTMELKDNGIYFFKGEPELWYFATTDGKVKPQTKLYIDDSKVAVKNGSEIDGTHFVKVISTNRINGKTSTLTRHFSVVVDNTPPVVNVEAPHVINTTSSANVKIFVKDEYLKYAYLMVKLEDGRILYDNVYGENGTKVVNLRQVLSGINDKGISISLIAYDMAGNSSELLTKDVEVDTVPPYIKSVLANEDGIPLMVKMSENVKGNPKVKLISKDGKEVLSGIGKIKGDTIYVYAFKDNKKIETDKVYKVEIENVTDNAGNAIGNNFTEWHF